MKRPLLYPLPTISYYEKRQYLLTVTVEDDSPTLFHPTSTALLSLPLLYSTLTYSSLLYSTLHYSNLTRLFLNTSKSWLRRQRKAIRKRLGLESLTEDAAVGIEYSDMLHNNQRGAGRGSSSSRLARLSRGLSWGWSFDTRY